MPRHNRTAISWVAVATAVIALTSSVAFAATPQASAPPRAPPPTSADRPGAPLGALTVKPGTYPRARTVAAQDILAGAAPIKDPYRWMEDPAAPGLGAFIAAQNNLTDRLLAACPSRPALASALKGAYDYEKWGLPFKAGGRYFYRRNAGLKNQPILYSRPTLDGPPAVVLDPNTLRADGTVALQEFSINRDGTLLAAAFSTGGSDWRTVRVYRINPDGTGTLLPYDKLVHVKFTQLSWTRDGGGFFYSRYQPPAGGDTSGAANAADSVQQLWYHVVGTDQADDVHVFSADGPTDFLTATATGDGQHLVLQASSTQSAAASRLLVADLAAMPKLATVKRGGSAKPSSPPDLRPYNLARGKAARPLPWAALPMHGGYEFQYVAGYGDELYFLTTWNAPRYRIVRLNLKPADGAALEYEDVVPEHSRDLLQAASPTVSADGSPALLLTYLHDVKTALRLVSASDGSSLGEVPLPGPGTASVSTDRSSSEVFFKFMAFTNPGTVNRWNAAAPAEAPTLWKAAKVRGIDLADYETTQVFLPSKDGRANVPLFITARKGMPLDGANPAVLYGYGGFNIVNGIEFEPDVLVAAHGYGAVYASCNMRGGGEYGERWHADGVADRKQNTFDDFYTCAEYLVAAGYTTPAKLTIHGASFGGTLVATAANQRPDLFGCVLCDVPVTDITRFQKFTVGIFWESDYGNPEDAVDLPFIQGWSPLHNVVAPAEGTRQYPAILVSTAEFDDRVPPLHSLKYAATLQSTLAGSTTSPQRNALALRVETQAGHGGGKPISKYISDSADKWSFCMTATASPWKVEAVGVDDGRPRAAAAEDVVAAAAAAAAATAPVVDVMA
jgi:prolyl oligopeptidase